jgi:hypothetical protein
MLPTAGILGKAPRLLMVLSPGVDVHSHFATSPPATPRPAMSGQVVEI